jgi:hypothetical protein
MRPSTVGATTPRPAGEVAEVGHTGTGVSAIVS